MGKPAAPDRPRLTPLSHSFTLDVIVHCRTEREAEEVRKAIAERLRACGLELHPEKTKIVYCKDI
jgi:retron-type reverse transcriptase